MQCKHWTNACRGGHQPWRDEENLVLHLRARSSGGNNLVNQHLQKQCAEGPPPSAIPDIKCKGGHLPPEKAQSQSFQPDGKDN